LQLEKFLVATHLQLKISVPIGLVTGKNPNCSQTCNWKKSEATKMNLIANQLATEKSQWQLYLQLKNMCN
jgi:hypothetical protein